MGKLFGTDGVRGVANIELTPELAYEIGRAGGFVLTHGNRGKVVVGKDTRASSDMLEAAISAGLCSIGLDVIQVGIIPTPAVAYLTRRYNALAGVVISASHNPYEYNGIKFFSADGYKLPDEIEDEIEDILLNNKSIELRPIKNSIGRIYFENNAPTHYKEYLKEKIGIDLKGYKIAMDCGNGALYKIGPEIIRELNGDVIAINTEPDGTNINNNCGSTNPHLAQQLVLDTNADLGISFDGDGDRIIAIDEKGRIIDGDHLLAICGRFLKKQNHLNGNTIVATVMSNMGLEVFLSQNEINLLRTPVGDRYIIEEMKKGNYVLGGEQSGHIIFMDLNTTGDGLATGLQLLKIMIKENEKASSLNDLVENLPQVLINARVKPENKNKFLDFPEIENAIKELEKKFRGTGRVLIRPSGTEPLVRVMIEGKDYDWIKKEAENLALLIEEILL
ncbi:MAG TPA: phosphoglucosamine mutase [Soehngenia sp.]|nr:phosphoglucosamine mutase [Soehngenia sp.]HPP31733.1 phosphoglucosamine mutase [Soehngenia sp.]